MKAEQMAHNCRVCGTPLIVGENITQNAIDHGDYICRYCDRERQREMRCKNVEHYREYNHAWYRKNKERAREYVYRTGRHQPMNENHTCSAFLGVYVAERVLSHVFKNVHRMPINNPGFDFFCGCGYRVDVKSSCRSHHEEKTDRWIFSINKNQIAEHFLCLAFDNRDDLNPEHMWIIPACDVNDHVTISISETTLHKWDHYRLDVDKVKTGCNVLRGKIL